MCVQVNGVFFDAKSALAALSYMRKKAVHQVSRFRSTHQMEKKKTVVGGAARALTYSHTTVPLLRLLQVTKFRGNWEVGSEFAIPVYAYSKTFESGTASVECCFEQTGLDYRCAYERKSAE